MPSLTLFLSAFLRANFEFSLGLPHPPSPVGSFGHHSGRPPPLINPVIVQKTMKPHTRRKGPPPPLDLRDSQSENDAQLGRLTPTLRTPTPRATATPIQIIPVGTPTSTTSRIPIRTTTSTSSTTSLSPTRATTVTTSTNRCVSLEKR